MNAPALDPVLEAFRKWLYLPDAVPLLALLGTVAANRMPGDPVWLMLVAPPGSGKTEQLESLRDLPGVHVASTLTEAALLSGTPRKECVAGSKGGLLNEIGADGTLMLKDFGSVLSMHREERARVLAALREVYDGSWTRYVGSEGGRKLSWSGRIGLVAGCPPTIDRHQAVMATLGERFLLVRFGVEQTEAHTRKALAHAGREREMRRELSAAVASLFRLPRHLDSASADEATDAWLVPLAMLVSRCRSAVERDGYSREIELIPGPESPTRLAIAIKRLAAGLTGIGVEAGEQQRIVRRVALDSMPAIRRSVLAAVHATGNPSTTQVAVKVGYPSTTTKRALEDLAAYRVLVRLPVGEGKLERWRVAEAFTTLLGEFPEMSESPESSPEMSEEPRETSPSSNPEPMKDDKSGEMATPWRNQGCDA